MGYKQAIYPINTVLEAMSFSSPKNTPQAPVSTDHRAAGLLLIITVKLPEMIGTEGGTAGGGPAWGGCIGPDRVAPVQVT
jgi:hypothetical protein